MAICGCGCSPVSSIGCGNTTWTSMLIASIARRTSVTSRSAPDVGARRLLAQRRLVRDASGDVLHRQAGRVVVQGQVRGLRPVPHHLRGGVAAAPGRQVLEDLRPRVELHVVGVDVDDEVVVAGCSARCRGAALARISRLSVRVVISCVAGR